MPGTLIVNARLVNEGREFDGDLRFANGRITHVGGQLSAQPGDQVIEAGGRWLLPGMVDDQVHFREPGLTHKGDIATESAAAAAGGLTTFMDMPNTTPPTLDAQALQAKYDAAAGRAWSNFGFYLGASNDNLEAVRTLDPKTYELRDSGETWAVARESSRRSPFWVVVRYDWSDPESVRWTVLDSSYGGGGEGLVQIAPGDDGGSRVHAEWGYTGARGMQRPMIFLIQHGPVRRLIKRMWASALDRYAESSRR